MYKRMQSVQKALLWLHDFTLYYSYSCVPQIALLSSHHSPGVTWQFSNGLSHMHIAVVSSPCKEHQQLLYTNNSNYTLMCLLKTYFSVGICRVSDQYSDTTNNWTLIRREISHADNWL